MPNEIHLNTYFITVSVTKESSGIPINITMID